MEEKELNIKALAPSFGGMTPEMVCWFGQQLIREFAPSKQYTVSEWIDHVIAGKDTTGRKRKTLNGYRYCAGRVKKLMGHRLLRDISPADISEFFSQIRAEKAEVERKAVVKADVSIPDILREKGISKTRLAQILGISQSTVDRAIIGKNILWVKAEAIAAAVDRSVSDIFDEVVTDRPLSDSTQNSYRRFLSLVFAAGVRELQIPYNPVERVERPLRRRKKKVKVLQPDELQQVLQAADQEPIAKRLLIHIFLITGCRRGEVAGLTWSKVLWSKSAIKIDQEILYTPENGVYCEDSTKNGTDRILKLPAETMALLREYWQWQQEYKLALGSRWIESDYIFTGKYGGAIHPDSISGYINRFQEKYNLPPLHPHLFRHTMASVLIYAGMDMVTVASRMGHASVATTENYYAHLIEQADLESAECIADAVLRGEKISRPGSQPICQPGYGEGRVARNR